MNPLFRRERARHSLGSIRLVSSLASIWGSRRLINPNLDDTNSNYRVDTRKSVKEPPASNHVADASAGDISRSGRLEAVKTSPASVQSLLNKLSASSNEVVEGALDKCCVDLSENLVVDVIRKNACDWKPAYTFFNWANRRGGCSFGSSVYNEILDVLGKMRRFHEMEQVLDGMAKRKGLFDETTYAVLVRRFAAAHKVDEAIDVFNRREDFGLHVNLDSFRELLMWLCRHRHVEEAETLFYSKKKELGMKHDIKSMNIILNGWCVLGDVREAKRFWKDIFASNCRPDRFTYGTFINALTKKGKLGSALKLFRAMWDNSHGPDVAICNCMIDALCFKKRIPEALEIFQEMKEKGCAPNSATYNSLIKHMCNIGRMGIVNELASEMESKGGSCSTNALTYSYLFNSLQRADGVPEVMQRMQRNGCEMNGDLFNLVLRLYMGWGHKEGVMSTWVEMQRRGLGHDRRSYTIMIHGLYHIGRMEDALMYYEEMVSKGMCTEPRTEILINDIKGKMKKQTEGEGGEHLVNKRCCIAMSSDEKHRRQQYHGNLSARG
ncbi:hypothetical protein SAY87_002979 [Trapa incisa]|uniref:Pentatricopeptide repeat-containing protein n=1 Tax=Trapa incisa TaxID=236973 RepID=A0AAN7QIE4_9MYRT|nr:hypothetical protein SAY87_002979 [Trapa incisa]